MRSYWLKIGFGAMLIFVVGFGLISAGRKVKSSIAGGHDVEIPLGSFVPFKFEGARVGTIRSITLRRNSPHGLSGVNVRLRTTDSTVFAKLENCSVSVSDAHNIDERTTLICLPSDSGYQAFGEVSVDLRTSNANRTLVRPLLLPEAVIAGLHRGRDTATATGLADSIAAVVRVRVRPLQVSYDDSVEAARLDLRSATYQKRADSIKQRADSIRARGKGGSVPVPITSGVPERPKP